MKKKGFRISLILIVVCAIIIAPIGGLSVKAQEISDADYVENETEYTNTTEYVNEIENATETEYISETEGIEEEELESEIGSGIIVEGGMIEIPPQDGNTAEIQVDGLVVTPVIKDDGSYGLPDGVYAFENLGNSGLFMDIQQDKYLPGYHMQQYAASGNPASTFDRSCLFKITWRAETDSYIIRSMLNNRLTFYFSGNEVLTKEISPNDADVPDSDTFQITYITGSGGFIIKPYNSTYVVAANNTTASGMAGAPNSYLKKSTGIAAGDQGKWLMYRYTGSTQSNVIFSKNHSTTNGMEIGTTYSFKTITWTTEIGKNTPYATVNPDYTDMAIYSWNSSTYTLSVTPIKAGPIKLRGIIRSDGTETAFRTFAFSYVVTPYINGKVGFLKNSATGRYMDVEGPSKTEGAFIQQWQFNDKTQSKWLFEVQSGGYFSIKSQYSNMYVGVDPTNTSYIRQYDTIENNTLWKFIETSSGNYKLVCKSLEASGYVLATQSQTSGNGSNLTMTAYTDDNNYRDEWNPQQYVVFDNMVIDYEESAIVDPYAIKDTVDASPTAFTYTIVDGSNMVSINNATAEITAIDSGKYALIKATDIAGEIQYFRVFVPKRAIIIIPGIMGSELVSADDSSEVWWDEAVFDGSLTESEIIRRLEYLRCDENGVSENDIVPYDNKYGWNNTYQTLYDRLEANFGEQYEICFFAYDWRLSNRLSGEKLDEYIQEKGFKRVVLVCHSMGGLVASSYLTIGQAQQDKVETLISLGTPYLGTPVMVHLWKSGNIKVLVPNITNGMVDLVAQIAPVFNYVDSLIHNFKSVYELFPTEEYFFDNYFDSPYVTSYEVQYDSMGNILIGPEFMMSTYPQTQSVLKANLFTYRESFGDDADDFHSTLFVDGEHITSFVDSYYISTSFNNPANATENTTYKIRLHPLGTYDVYKTYHGDQMVPVWSADLGGRYPEKTYYKNGVKHGSLVTDTGIFSFIKNLIKQDETIPLNSGIMSTYAY